MLICLGERPMHPYEAATTLRERQKHESVRLNYGSLYAVVASLERRGLIAPHETVRCGRRPERTVYALTAAGATELRDWLTQLISTPVKDYTSFEAALSFLPALPPEHVLELLRARAEHLQQEGAARHGSRGLEEEPVPRLFWVEEEFRSALRDAELRYVRQLITDIGDGTLEGIEWWKRIHAPNDSGETPEPPGATDPDDSTAAATREARAAN